MGISTNGALEDLGMCICGGGEGNTLPGVSREYMREYGVCGLYRDSIPIFPNENQEARGPCYHD